MRLKKLLKNVSKNGVKKEKENIEKFLKKELNLKNKDYYESYTLLVNSLYLLYLYKNSLGNGKKISLKDLYTLILDSNGEGRMIVIKFSRCPPRSKEELDKKVVVSNFFLERYLPNLEKNKHTLILKDFVMNEYMLDNFEPYEDFSSEETLIDNEEPLKEENLEKSPVDEETLDEFLSDDTDENDNTFYVLENMETISNSKETKHGIYPVKDLLSTIPTQGSSKLKYCEGYRQVLAKHLGRPIIMFGKIARIVKNKNSYDICLKDITASNLKEIFKYDHQKILIRKEEFSKLNIKPGDYVEFIGNVSLYQKKINGVSYKDLKVSPTHIIVR